MTLTDRQFQLSRGATPHNVGTGLLTFGVLRPLGAQIRASTWQLRYRNTSSTFGRSTTYLVFKAHFCFLLYLRPFSFHRRNNPCCFQRNKLRPSLLPRINAFAVKRALNRARMDLSSNNHYLHLRFLSLARPFGLFSIVRIHALPVTRYNGAFEQYSELWLCRRSNHGCVLSLLSFFWNPIQYGTGRIICTGNLVRPRAGCAHVG